jgi:hypothetical protein
MLRLASTAEEPGAPWDDALEVYQPAERNFVNTCSSMRVDLEFLREAFGFSQMELSGGTASLK